MTTSRAIVSMLLIGLLIGFAVSASAQTPAASNAQTPPGSKSWCYWNTDDFNSKSARKYVEMRCDIEQEELKLALKALQKTARTIEVDSTKTHRVISGDIDSTDTFTERSSKTRDAGKLELELAKLEAKVAIKTAQANRPATDPCASWILAPSYCYGYSSSGYYSGGYVQQYDTYGREGYRTQGNGARPYRSSSNEGVNNSASTTRYGSSGAEGVRNSSSTVRYGSSGAEGVRNGAAIVRYNGAGSEGARFSGNIGTAGRSGSEGVNGGGSVQPYRP